MMKMERQLLRELFPNIRRHLVNVLHDLHRILKHMRIDPLEQIGLVLPICNISCLIGCIDISHCDRSIRIQFSRQAKFFSDVSFMGSDHFHGQALCTFFTKITLSQTLKAFIIPLSLHILYRFFLASQSQHRTKQYPLLQVFLHEHRIFLLHLKYPLYE